MNPCFAVVPSLHKQVWFWAQAGAKSTAATSLKFQAEATAHLQTTGVGRTQDAPKYQDEDIEVNAPHCEGGVFQNGYGTAVVY